MTPYTTIQAIEGMALCRHHANAPGSSASGTIAGHEVVVTITTAMINRGNATGDVKRYGYKLDGRRISRTELLRRLSA